MTGVEGGSPKDAAAASVTASSTINIYGGKWLYTQSGYSDAWSTLADSASYRYGTSSQKDGFITCGHGWDVGDSVYYGNTYLGKITYKWRNEYVDVAFVESSHYSTGRMLSSSGPYVTSRGNPTSGATIYMYGANGVKSGKVINTNIDGWWSSTRESSDIYHSGFFSTECVPANGDSGGAILEKRSDGNYKIVGTIVGKYNSQTQGAGCPWNTIESKCKLVPTV